MDQLVVAEEYIIENVDDEVHVERSAVTNECQEQSNQPKIEIVNKKPASPNLNNSISEHSYSFNTEKPSNANNDNILDVENQSGHIIKVANLLVFWDSCAKDTAELNRRMAVRGPSRAPTTSAAETASDTGASSSWRAFLAGAFGSASL